MSDFHVDSTVALTAPEAAVVADDANDDAEEDAGDGPRILTKKEKEKLKKEREKVRHTFMIISDEPA